MSNTYYLYSFYNTSTTPTHCILISSCPITSFVKQIGDQVPKRSCQVKVMKPALRRVGDNFWSRKLRFLIVQFMPLLLTKKSQILQTISVTNLTGLPTDTHLLESPMSRVQRFSGCDSQSTSTYVLHASSFRFLSFFHSSTISGK